MAFWRLAYNMKWVDAEKLRLVVKTAENLYGEITAEDYKTITGQDF